MPSSLRALRAILATGYALLIVACGDTENATMPREAVSSALGPRVESLVDRPILADTILEVTVQPSAHWSTAVETDAELERSVRGSGGVVAIGFKEPTQVTSRQSGRFPAFSRARATQFRALAEQAGATILQSFRNSATVIVKIDPAAAATIRRLPFINYIEAPRPASPGQSGSQLLDSSAVVVGAPMAWLLSASPGVGATITFLDTGLDSVHVNTVQGDGPANLSHCAYVSSASSCYSSNVHGAGVAGVAAARNNCCGRIGIAYAPTATNLLRVQDDNGAITDQAIAVGLDWATSLAVPRHIVNISIQGCKMGSVVSEAVARANAAGLLIVSIAGNTDWDCSGFVPGATGVTYPGRYPEVLAVSGTDLGYGFASAFPGSRYGPQVVLSAPFYVQSMGAGGTIYPLWSGTSFAAPSVSAVAALVWSANPSWTAAMVRARLIASAVDLGPVGWDQQFGYGRVSALNAAQPPFSVSISGTSAVFNPGTYSWTAQPSGASNPYSYTWAYRSVGTTNWVTLSSGPTAQRTVTAATPSFQLRVTATSPGWQGSVTGALSVTMSIDGGCNPFCEE